MTASIPTTEPSEFVAGDTVQWTRSVPDYTPADGWTLTYAFVREGVQFTVTGTDNGDGSHAATILSDASADIAPGEYRWQAYVTDAMAVRHTVDEGRTTVRPNFAVEDKGHDDRTPARKWLDDLLEAREKLGAGARRVTVSSYNVGGRTLSYRDLEEIDAAIQRAKADVAKEERRARVKRGLGHRGRVLVRFT